MQLLSDLPTSLLNNFVMLDFDPSKIIKNMIENKADISDWDVLHSAAKRGQPHIIRLLLDNNAFFRRSHLSTMVDNGHLESIKMLFEHVRIENQQISAILMQYTHKDLTGIIVGYCGDRRQQLISVDEEEGSNGTLPLVHAINVFAQKKHFPHFPENEEENRLKILTLFVNHSSINQTFECPGTKCKTMVDCLYRTVPKPKHNIITYAKHIKAGQSVLRRLKEDMLYNTRWPTNYDIGSKKENMDKVIKQLKQDFSFKRAAKRLNE